MLAKWKKVLDNTPTTIRQLLGLRETTLAVMKFIAPTGGGRRPLENELAEETDARDTRQGVESERLKRDKKQENREKE